MGFYGDLMDFMVILSCFVVMLWFQLEFGWNCYGIKNGEFMMIWPSKNGGFCRSYLTEGFRVLLSACWSTPGVLVEDGKDGSETLPDFFGYIQGKSSSLGPYILKKDGALSFWGTTGLLKDKLWEAQKLQLGKTSNSNADTPGLKILRPGELVAGREPQFPLWVPHFFKKSSKK